MTREDKLWTMKMQDLVGVAEKLGIKINTKAAKSQAIEKILKAEASQSKEMVKEKMKSRKNKLVPMPGTTDPDWGKKHYSNDDIAGDGTPLAEVGKEIAAQAKEKANQVIKPKRGALIPYNGKSQTITEWSKELNISIKTLYGRLYELNWPIEKAFTYSRKKKST